MKSYSQIALTLGVLSCASFAFGQFEFETNPLEDIAYEMKVSASQLSKKVTAKPAQKPQQDAVDQLDALIAKLEEERRKMQGRGQSTANPTIPANASNIMSGPGGSGDLQSVRDDRDRWGDLPAHERDRILQSLTEGFPPHYQAILEAYYKRLATEQSTDDDADLPAMPKRPAKTPGASKAMPAAPRKPKTPAKKADQ